MWIYLPALKKSRRLVANNKKDSFVGSDFSYGDDRRCRRSIQVPAHAARIGEGGRLRLSRDRVVCRRTTPSRSTAATARRSPGCAPTTFVETKVEYYDLAGRLLKTQKTGKHQLVEPDKARWFALYREMTNHQNGHRTTIDASKADAVPIPDEMFTTRFLERE